MGSENPAELGVTAPSREGFLYTFPPDSQKLPGVVGLR